MKKMLILLTLLVTASIVLSATAYRSYQFGAGRDSVRILMYRNHVLFDSISQDSLSSFPIAGNITIDDQNHWRLEYYTYWAGNPTPVFGDEVVWGKADSIVPSSPASINLCNVYGTVVDAAGSPVRYAQIVFTLPSKEVFNSCDNTIIGTNIVKDETRADGLFETDLPKSKCIGDQQWLMTVTYKDADGATHTRVNNRPITVPDATSYEVTF